MNTSEPGFKTENGVKVVFDNNTIYGSTKHILAFKNDNLIEVNLDGYWIIKKGDKPIDDQINLWDEKKWR